MFVKEASVENYDSSRVNNSLLFDTSAKHYSDVATSTTCLSVSMPPPSVVQVTPRIFIINYATLVDDTQETESLCVPFEMMRHSVMMDMTPSKFGGEGGMRVEEEFFPFCFDDEKLFFEIEHPTPEDMETYDWYKSTSPYPFLNETRWNKKKVIEIDIPISEWRKRFTRNTGTYRNLPELTGTNRNSDIFCIPFRFLDYFGIGKNRRIQLSSWDHLLCGLGQLLPCLGNCCSLGLGGQLYGRYSMLLIYKLILLNQLCCTVSVLWLVTINWGS
jgi:hypothetical protein